MHDATRLVLVAILASAAPAAARPPGESVETRVYDINDFLCGSRGQSDNPVSEEDLIEQIVSLITETVDSDSWKDNGGVVGSIKELGGQLVITNTPAAHENVAKLLRLVRDGRRVSVEVDVRVVVVRPSELPRNGDNLMTLLPTARWLALADAGASTTLLASTLSARSSMPSTLTSDRPAGSMGVRLEGDLPNADGRWLDRTRATLIATHDTGHDDVTIEVAATISRVSAAGKESTRETAFGTSVTTNAVVPRGHGLAVVLGQTADNRSIVFLARPTR